VLGARKCHHQISFFFVPECWLESVVRMCWIYLGKMENFVSLFLRKSFKVNNCKQNGGDCQNWGKAIAYILIYDNEFKLLRTGIVCDVYTARMLVYCVLDLIQWVLKEYSSSC